MKFTRIIASALALALLFPPSSAKAQSVEAGVIPGYMSTTGCPSAATTPCFVPYSATNPLSVGGSYAGPTSTLTSGTGTAITPTNNFIASSATAGSIVVPYFTVAQGNSLSPKMNLTTNATSGWGAASFVISFWTAAPTYTNGDGGVYAATTGSAVLLDQYTCTFIQYVDKAQAVCVPNSGPVSVLLPPASKVYWDIYSNSTVTKTSGQTFTLTDFLVN